MRALICVLLATVVALGGCSSADESSSEVGVPPSPDEGTTVGAPRGEGPGLLALADVCTVIEDEMPKVDFGYPATTKEQAEFYSYAQVLYVLANDADAEAAAALESYAKDMEYVSFAEDPTDRSEHADRALLRIKAVCGAAGAPIFGR